MCKFQLGFCISYVSAAIATLYVYCAVNCAVAAGIRRNVRKTFSVYVHHKGKKKQRKGRNGTENRPSYRKGFPRQGALVHTRHRPPCISIRSQRNNCWFLSVFLRVLRKVSVINSALNFYSILFVPSRPHSMLTKATH